MKDGKVICHIYHCDVSARSGKTSNLIRHLCHKRPIMYAESSLVRTPGTAETSAKASCNQLSIKSSFDSHMTAKAKNLMN